MLHNWKAAILSDLKRWRTWLNMLLLAALPWAAEIKQLLADNLTALQPYLPENVYKFMGGAVVVTGMILSLVASHRAVKAANDA
jgi:hypothetical protein